MSDIMAKALELMGVGMGGIFVVMILLYGISQVLLKLTAPKKTNKLADCLFIRILKIKCRKDDGRNSVVFSLCNDWIIRIAESLNNFSV